MSLKSGPFGYVVTAGASPQHLGHSICMVLRVGEMLLDVEDTMHDNLDTPTEGRVILTREELARKRAQFLAPSNPTPNVLTRWFEEPLLRSLGTMSKQWFKERDRRGDL